MRVKIRKIPAPSKSPPEGETFLNIEQGMSNIEVHFIIGYSTFIIRY